VHESATAGEIAGAEIEIYSGDRPEQSSSSQAGHVAGCAAIDRQPC
jgi:hypothetical protein